MEPKKRHVAIIMDGNGRWATARGLPRVAGHRAGAEAVRRVVEAAPALGVGTLTLYAFSSDNWRRPPAEVAALLALFERLLLAEATRCAEVGVRLGVIGRRDRLPPRLVRAIEAAERLTAGGGRLTVRLALDYSSRDALLAAAAVPGAARSRDAFRAALARALHADDAPDVDVLVRTGGEQRLSDFLLWECAYAEFVFLDARWPDIDGAVLADALARFRARDRRFGALPQAA